MATPSLAMIPSGYKASKVYSVLPESGVGDFDFTRATTATRVNSSGLIEEMAINVPRLEYPLIDGVVNGCPSLILEPHRTNLIPYSESINNWMQERVTVTVDSVISPQGNMSADKINIDSTATATHQAYIGPFTNTVGNVCVSGFFKKGEYEWVHIGSGTATSKAFFNLNNGTIGEKSQDVVSSNIIDYGNGWYRCISVVNLSTTSNFWEFGMAIEDGERIINGTPESGGFYAWGIQVEDASSYATSYIKTNGSAVTRNAETCNGAGDASTFNDSEGVLFANVKYFTETDSFNRSITISNNTINNRLQITLLANGELLVLYQDGSGIQTIQTTNKPTQFNKVALSYGSNSLRFYLNGIEIENVLGNFSSMNSLKTLRLDNTISEDFYGSTKEIAYYDTSLTDLELEQLTSWTSFSDMANGQQYSII